MAATSGAYAPYRTHLMPKVWFFTYNVGAVFFLPYINLFYRHLGFSEQAIGVLAALKPWVSAPAGQLIVSLADSWLAHVAFTLVTYLIMVLGRGAIIVVSSFGAQAFLALLTEAAAAPLGCLIDAAVIASATDEGGYGRQRMFASVGWGGASPLAGAAVARIGLQAAFSIYLVIGLLVFLPTCLLPIGILSAAKKADGSGTAGKGGGDGSRTTGELAAEGSAPKFEDSGSGSEAAGEIESLEVTRRANSVGLLSPQERRARMDSDIASREGSKLNLLALVPAAQQQPRHPPAGSSGGGAAKEQPPPAPAGPAKEGSGLEHQWTISAGAGASVAAEAVAIAAAAEALRQRLPYGVFHLTADARTPTEQLQEMEGGGPLQGSPAPWGSASKQSAAGGGAGSPLLQAKGAALADDADSGCSAKAGGGHSADAPAADDEAHGSVVQGLRRLLADRAVVLFFALAFLMGIGNGCIGFLFLYLDELGATASLMGLCLSFNCLAEVPVFYYSGQIIERLGVERAFNLAMCAYVARLCCYIALPVLPSVWWVLPVELLQGLTFALAWSSGCVYVKRIAPVWLRSTTQGVFQGLYAGIGAGLGGLVGGFLYGNLGAGVLFKTAAATLAVGLAAATLVRRAGAGGGSGSGARYQGYARVEFEEEEEGS